MTPTHPDGQELLAHLHFAQRVARALLRDANAADDVAQQAMVVALERLPHRDTSLRAWLAETVRRLVFTQNRSEARRRTREESVARMDAAGDTDWTAAAVQRGETRQALVQEVLKLREPYRTAIVLRYMEELTPQQIAQALDEPIGTVKSRLQRGLALMRERFESQNPDEDEWRKKLMSVAFPVSVATAPAWGVTALVATGVAAVLVASTVLVCWPPDEAEEPPRGKEVVAAVVAEVDDAPTPASETATRDVEVTPAKTDAPTTRTERQCSLLVSQVDGAPVDGARIRVTRRDGSVLEATTGPSGRTRMARDEVLSLRVEADGLRPLWRSYAEGLPARERLEMVSAEWRALRVVDAMTGLGVPAAAVSFQLSGFEGEPSQASFSFADPAAFSMGNLAEWMEPRFEMALADATNSDGWSRVPRAPCTDVQVCAPGYVPRSSHVHESPSDPAITLTVQPAARLLLERGAQHRDRWLHVHITTGEDPFATCLHCGPGESLEPLDLPAGPCDIHVVASDASRLFSTAEDFSAFESELEALESLQALCDGRDPPWVHGMSATPLAGGVEQRRVQLKLGTTEIVELFGGGEALDLTVRGLTMAPGTHASLVDLEDGVLCAISSVEGRSARFGHVPEGSYLLQITHDSNLQGTVRLDVPAAPRQSAMEAELRPAALTLTVQGLGEQAEPLVLRLRGAFDERHAAFVVRDGGAGQCRFEGLLPGDYDVECALGSRWITHALQVSEGEQTAVLDVALAATHHVEFRLRGDEAATDWSVTWAGSDGAAIGLNAFGCVEAGQEVAASFDVPAGDYVVYTSFGDSWEETRVSVRGAGTWEIGGGPYNATRVRLLDARHRPITWTNVALMRRVSVESQDALLDPLDAYLRTDARGAIDVRLAAGRYEVITENGWRGSFTLRPDLREQLVTVAPAALAGECALSRLDASLAPER